jgi:hypothetical protein
MKRSRQGIASRTIKSFFTPAPTPIIQPAPQTQPSAQPQSEVVEEARVVEEPEIAEVPSNANGLQNNPTLLLVLMTLFLILGFGHQLSKWIQTLGMQLEDLIFLRVHANQKVIVIQKGRYTIAIGHFMIYGSRIMHGWNTVLQKMPHFVFTVISSNNLELKILVLMLSRLMGFVDGRTGVN